ncbi:MAG: ABC transporter substrate-binding protein [Chloroflexi bacterium]|nr:ABC transporter substrate-binding protein [Chloroflexota bacterium]
MKRKYLWLSLTCVMVLSLVLASCAPAAAPMAPTAPTTPTAPTAPTVPTAPVTPAAPAVEKPKYGGTVTALIPSLAGFSPIVAASTTSGLYALHLTNDGLWSGDWAKGPAGSGAADFLNFTWGLEFGTMMLADSYELPGDNTLIYHLKKGIHFSLDPKNEASRLVNGRELTAQDVVYSLNAMYFDPEGPGGKFGRITPAEKVLSIEAPDKYTVKIKYPPGTKSSTVYYTSTFSYIFPLEVYEKYSKMRDWKNSVGTGPFMLTDYVDGSSVTFTRNPNYWKTDPVGAGKGNQLPYADTAKFLIITDRSTQDAAFRTGKIDVIGTPIVNKLENYEQFAKQRPDIKYVKYPAASPTVVALVMNNPKLPWYEKKVRQAMTMAIDYNTIIKDYYKGDARFVFPISPYRHYLSVYTPPEQWPQAVKDIYTYNPTKAKQLLAEAGYPSGFKISVLTKAVDVDELSIIKEYWAKIGVDMTLDVRETGVWTSITNGMTQKEAVGGTRSVATVYDFGKTLAGSAENQALINDPYSEQLYLDTREDYITNESKLNPKMKEYFLNMLEQAWYIAMPGPNGYNFWQPWIKNYHGEVDIGPTSRMVWVTYIWIDQALKKSMGF